MTVAIDTIGRGALTIDITGVTSTSAGGIGYVANPENATCLITKATLYISTASTGSAVVSIGVAAAKTTSAADILNALDLATTGAINCFVRENGAKTAISGGVPALWTPDKYITFSGASSTEGLVAKLFIEYLVVT